MVSEALGASLAALSHRSLPKARAARGFRESKRVKVRCHLSSYSFRAPSYRCSFPTMNRFAAASLRGSGGQASGNKRPQHNDAETTRTPDAGIAAYVSTTFRDGVAFLTGFACLLISSNVIV